MNKTTDYQEVQLLNYINIDIIIKEGAKISWIYTRICEFLGVLFSNSKVNLLYLDAFFYI